MMLPESLAWFAGIAGAAGFAAWALAGIRTLRRLSDLERRLGAAPFSHGIGAGVLEHWRRQVRSAAQSVAQAEQARDAERQRLGLLAARRRESDDLYRLATEKAADGMWEWDLRTGAAAFSPRWRSMLGYGGAEPGSRADDWRALVHADDRPGLEHVLAMHLEGHSPRAEHEHRLRHRDGDYRWVLMRAHALRQANGRPYRLIGQELDITTRWQVSRALGEAAHDLAGLEGDACYWVLVESFARATGMEEVYLCEVCDDPPTRVRMLAHWRDGGQAECEPFDLSGTPCAEVIRSARILFQPAGAGRRWPQGFDGPAEAYLGVPCTGSRGEVIGHIACRSPQAVPAQLPHDAILRLFAVRAAIEMERRLIGTVRRSAL